MFLTYALLLYRILLPASPASENLQRIIDESMIHRQGAAVAIDVETGQVLASYRMDVAARRLAAPGSAIKPFTLMALLDAGIVKEETSLFCPRTVRIGTHILDCSHPRSPDPLDPVMALAYSCNHFFTATSERLPFDALPREFSSVGLNSVTGKWQTELPGVVDQPHSKQAMQLMSVGEEGIKVTPLGAGGSVSQHCPAIAKSSDSAEGTSTCFERASGRGQYWNRVRQPPQVTFTSPVRPAHLAAMPGSQGLHRPSLRKWSLLYFWNGERAERMQHPLRAGYSIHTIRVISARDPSDDPSSLTLGFSYSEHSSIRLHPNQSPRLCRRPCA